MKKTFLSAAAVMAGLALAGSPAMAQSNEIVIGITVTTTGPAAALGIPERNSLDFVPKEIGGVPLKLIVLDDGGDPTTATTNARRFVTESKADIIMGSSTTPPTVAVSTVANEAGHSAFRPGAVPDQRSAREVVGRHAAADSDHGQGAVRAHEGARHQDRRLYRLLQFLRRSLDERLQDPGHPDGIERGDRRAFRPSGYVGRGPGAEDRRRQPRRRPRRRLRDRRGAAADDAARAWLQGPDLPDPRRRQHGLHPHRRPRRPRA